MPQIRRVAAQEIPIAGTGGHRPALDLIVDAVGERSARGVAAAISRLVHTGRLVPGSRLPTVRELARELGSSPVLVSAAWQALARAGIVESRGRLGSFVKAAPRGGRRYARVAGDVVGEYRLDLSTGTPDPDLLPDLGPALARVGHVAGTTSYLDDPVLPALAARLAGSWPFPPEELTVTDGALDALDRLVTLLVRLGDRVVVENPTFPGLLDLLDARGAQLLPVGVDVAGALPDDLAAALAAEPVAVFLQPRSHNPTGAGLTRRRAAELAAVLSGAPDVVIVEDDHTGDLSGAPDTSLGRHLPQRTVRIRSFSKSYGPDLRLAAVGGAADVVGALERRRRLGPGWSSRLLQGVLLDLLTDPVAQTRVAAARHAYAERRRVLRDALARHGVRCATGDGVNLWVPVEHEQQALVALAAAGVRASPGSPFVADGGAPLGDHIRITCGLLHGGRLEAAELAALVAAASGGR